MDCPLGEVSRKKGLCLAGPRFQLFDPLQKFPGQGAIAFGPHSGGIVGEDGSAMAGRLRQAHGPGNDALEYLVGKMLLDIGEHLLAEPGARVVHGHEDADDFEIGIEALVLDFLDESQDFRNAFEGVELALDGDDQAVGGGQGAGHEDAEGRGAVDHDEIKGGVVPEGVDHLAEAGEGIFELGDLHLASGQVDFGRNEGKKGELGGLELVLDGALPDERGIDAGAGRFRGVTQPAGGVGLGIEVDQEGLLFEFGQGRREVDGGGGFSHSPFLVGDGDNSHGTIEQQNRREMREL